MRNFEADKVPKVGPKPLMKLESKAQRLQPCYQLQAVKIYWKQPAPQVMPKVQARKGRICLASGSTCVCVVHTITLIECRIVKSHPKNWTKASLLSVFQMIACFEKQIFKIRPFGLFYYKK